TREQKLHAEDASAAANQVNSFLVDMLQAADPSLAQGKAVLVRDVLDTAASSVGTKFTAQPRVEAAVRLAIGKTYHGLGLDSQAEPHLMQAIAINRRLGGDDDPETISAREWLGFVRHKQGKLDEALAIQQDVLARRRRIFGDRKRETIDAVNNL